MVNLWARGSPSLLIARYRAVVIILRDRILVIFEGRIVAELDPKQVTVQELGLYMAGSKKEGKTDEDKEK